MKSLTIIILLSLVSLVSCSKKLSEQSLEEKLSEMFQQEEVKQYFEGQIIVILNNESCNENICNPKDIISETAVKFYSKQEAFMRGLSKTITIIEMQDINAKTTRFKVKMNGQIRQIDVKMSSAI